MQSLEDELDQARALDVATLADAIESLGFECTRCGACCTAEEGEAHTATVFPDEARTLTASADVQQTASATAQQNASSAADTEWRNVVRPMPYGLREADNGLEGETFEWALQTDDCGDCTFYTEDESGVGTCLAHADRPLICQTYPFSVALTNSSDEALAGPNQPMGEAVDTVALPAQRDADTGAGTDRGSGDETVLRVHECEGVGRDISRADAEELAKTLKTRTVRELEEAIAVRDAYEPASPAPGEIVVHDSEGEKRPDGTTIDDA